MDPSFSISREVSAAALSQIAIGLAFAWHRRREDTRFAIMAATLALCFLYVAGAWGTWVHSLPSAFVVFWLAATTLPFATWLLVVSLTSDLFVLTRRHQAIGAASFLIQLACFAIDLARKPPDGMLMLYFLFTTNMIMVFAFGAAALVAVVQAYRRRRHSAWSRRQHALMLMAGALVIGIGLAFSFVPNATLDGVYRSLNPLSAVIGLGVFLINLHMLVVDPEFLRRDRRTAEALAVEAAADLDVTGLTLREGLHLRPDLTIAGLARALQTTEPAIRAALKEQGFSHFNDFINHHRVQEAARRLRDPGLAHVKISAIALDCGFASLSPFNRAFRAVFGLTPSEYRARPDRIA